MYTFKNCKAITSLDLSGWDTSHVVNDVNQTFEGCANLHTIYASDSFTLSSTGATIFNGWSNLEGGMLTKPSDMPSSDRYKSKYACIDGKDGKPGYFTDIANKP